MWTTSVSFVLLQLGVPLIGAASLAKSNKPAQDISQGGDVQDGATWWQVTLLVTGLLLLVGLLIAGLVLCWMECHKKRSAKKPETKVGGDHPSDYEDTVRSKSANPTFGGQPRSGLGVSAVPRKDKHETRAC